MTWSTPIWATLIGLGVLTELVALRTRRRGDTLSEHFWLWTRPGLRNAPWWVWLGRVATFGFFTWLAVHFPLGWLTT